MTDALRLLVGWALPWLFGAALVAAVAPRLAGPRDGRLAWIAGAGGLVGLFLLTAWMRALSLAGVAFSIVAVGAPIVVATAALAFVAWKRMRGAAIAPIEAAATEAPAAPSPLARVGVAALGAWLVARFVVLFVEVVWKPLYPWDAWIQWATKARVWYELGRIVPFARSDVWFGAGAGTWFDASPNYPATVPLWQVWSNVALGRWDDALMNLPWWLVAVALALAVYGAVRGSGTSALVALVAAWLVSSLPLANVHVALAGYADLPMGATFCVAALALWRWSTTRDTGDAVVALLLAIACPTIKTPGIVWAATLLPALAFAVKPNLPLRWLGGAFAAGALALIAVARFEPTILGYRLHLDFAPAWSSLLDSFFLLGNWHLLWFAVIGVAALAWRELRDPALRTLTLVVACGAAFLFVVFAFTNAREWVADQTTVNRATLHLAPLCAVWMVLAFERWLARSRAAWTAKLRAEAEAAAIAQAEAAQRAAAAAEARQAKPAPFTPLR